MLNENILSKLYTWIWEVGVKYGFDDVCLRIENEIINVENCLPLIFGKGKQASLLTAARNVQIIIATFERDEYITDKINGFLKIIASLLQDSQLYSNAELIVPLLCFHQTSMLLIFSVTKVHRKDVLSIKPPYDVQWEIVKNYFHFKDDRYKEDVIKISEKGFEVKQELMDGSSRSPGFEEEFETYYFKWKIFEETLMKSLPIPQLQEICNENREEECFAFPEANKFLQIIQGSSNFTSKKLHQLIEFLIQDSYSSSSPPVSMNNSSLVIELDSNVLKSKQFGEPKAKSPSEEVQYNNITVVTNPLARSPSVEDDITRSRNNESRCKNVGNETYDIIELKNELWKIRNFCYKNENDSSGDENQRHHSPKEMCEIQIWKDFESPGEETVPITKIDSDIFYIDKVKNKLKWILLELETKAKSLKKVKDKPDIENWLVSQKQMEDGAVFAEYEDDVKTFENEKSDLTPFDNAKFNEISLGVSTMSFEDNQIFRSLESPGENASLGSLYTEKNPISCLQDQVKITTGCPMDTEENSSDNLLYSEENNSSGPLDTQENTTEENAAGGPLDAEGNISGCPLDKVNNTDTEENISSTPMDYRDNTTCGSLNTERNIADGLMDTEENTPGGSMNTEEDTIVGSMNTEKNTIVGPVDTEENISGGQLDKDENITDGQMDKEENASGSSVNIEEYYDLLGSEENITGGPMDTEKNSACISLDAEENTTVAPLENTTTDLLDSIIENTLQICDASSEEKRSSSCAKMSVLKSNYSNENISLSFTNNENLNFHFGSDNSQGTSDFVTKRNVKRSKNIINPSSDPQIKINEMNIKSLPMSSSAKGSGISSNSSNSSKSPPILSPQVKVGGCSNRSPQTFRSQDQADDFYDEYPPILSPQGKIDGLGGVYARVVGRKNESSQSLRLQERVGDLDTDSSQIFSPPLEIGCRNNDSSSTHVKIGSRNNESPSQQIKMDLEIGRKSSCVRLSPIKPSLLRKVTMDYSTNLPDKKKDYLSPVSAKSSKRKPIISESSMKKSCKRSSSCRKILKTKSRSCSDLIANSSESKATSPLSSFKGFATIKKRKLNLHVSLGAEEMDVEFLGKVFAANQNKESSEEEYFTPKSDLSVAQMVQQCKEELENSSSTTRKIKKSKKKKKPRRKSTTPRTEK